MAVGINGFFHHFTKPRAKREQGGSSSAFCSFKDCWLLIRNIVPGTTIEARSLNGRTQGRFQVTATGPDSVRVHADAIGSRRIPQSEFEMLFRLWPDYRTGELRLNSLAPRHSEYVLGIFHHIGMELDPQ